MRWEHQPSSEFHYLRHGRGKGRTVGIVRYLRRLPSRPEAMWHAMDWERRASLGEFDCLDTAKRAVEERGAVAEPMSEFSCPPPMSASRAEDQSPSADMSASD